jgi:hypothetical protein
MSCSLQHKRNIAQREMVSFGQRFNNKFRIQQSSLAQCGERVRFKVAALPPPPARQLLACKWLKPLHRKRNRGADPLLPTKPTASQCEHLPTQVWQCRLRLGKDRIGSDRDGTGRDGTGRGQGPWMAPSMPCLSQLKTSPGPAAVR